MKDFELLGKLEQVTTTGKNLFDIVSARNNDNYKPILGKPYELTAIEYDLVPNTDYVLSISKKISNPKSNLFIANATGRKSLAINNVFHQTVNSLESGIIYVGFSGISHDTGIPDFESEYFDIQLEVGTSRTPYEPYTGGKPSPSPEYLQEIKNVGKWNEEKQKYEVDVKITGKNLFDIEKAKSESNWVEIEGDGYVHFPIRAKKGSKVTFSYDEKLTTGKKFYLGVSIGKIGSVTNWLYHGATASLITNKCTIVSSDGYVNLLCNKGAVQDFINNIKTLQVEISDEPTEYQPYKEQTLTLTSDRSNTKWDKLVEKDGQIGWLCNTEKYIVTGSEDFKTLKSYNVERSIDYSFNNIKQIGSRKTGENFCNSLTYVDAVWEKPDVGFGISGNEVHIKLAYETIGSNKDEDDSIKKKKFIDYLTQRYNNGNPIIFYHKSKATEFVPLPQSEQNAIRALKTYYPTTVITVEGGEVEPAIEVTYIADTKNYIDQKIGATDKLVVVTQKALL